MTWKAALPTICAACRSNGALEVEQRLVKGVLSWRESFVCSCGHGFETASAGLPTPAARNALMAAHGAFELVIQKMPARSKAWKVLERLLEATPDETKRAVGELPSRIWNGTAGEVEFVRLALTRGGATVEVVNAKRAPVKSARAH